MDPTRDAILKLIKDAGPNEPPSELLDALKFTVEEPTTDWEYPPPPKSSGFKEPVASFEQFQAAINVHASIFQRPALQKLYLLFTEGTDAETSFVRTNRISHPQLWHSIDAGASAAIRSVREEFENTKTSKTLRKYLTDLQAGNNMTQLLFSCKGTHYPLNIASLTKPGKGFKFDWESPYDEWDEETLYEKAFPMIKSRTISEGVRVLLRSLEEQMDIDKYQGVRPWNPRNLGITIQRTWINIPELETGIWDPNLAVGSHYREEKITYRVPAPGHSGWQFFMSGAGDITHPHIDPPVTRCLFWQVVGSKLWCKWPATKENLAAFNQLPVKPTWQWAMDNLSESGRQLFIMEPGTWLVLNICEIHACISLTPSVHAVQEFFLVDDAGAALRIWKDTEEVRENSKRSQEDVIPEGDLPQALSEWLPDAFVGRENLDESVNAAIDMYEYGRNMVMSGKSDSVTIISELNEMLPLVRDWIEKAAGRT